MSQGTTHLLHIADNLKKNSGTPSTRSIVQGGILRVNVPEAVKGMMFVGLYQDNGQNNGTLIDIGVDGIPGEAKKTANNPLGSDPKDGIVDINLFFDNPVDGSEIVLPVGKYFYKCSASDEMSAEPEWWNYNFDIVPKPIT